MLPFALFPSFFSQGLTDHAALFRGRGVAGVDAACGGAAAAGGRVQALCGHECTAAAGAEREGGGDQLHYTGLNVRVVIEQEAKACRRFAGMIERGC